MTIKTKWNNLHTERAINYTWLFVNGRMLVINDSFQPGLQAEKLLKKKFYDISETEKEKMIKI